MAENKKSFIAYVDWSDTFKALPDEKAGQLIKHLFAYVNDENPESNDILITAVFANIKLQLKRDLKKWEGISNERTEIGRLGGIKSGEARRIKQEQKQANEPIALKSKQNEHVTDNDNDNDNVSVKKKVGFTPPFLADVLAYFKENGYTEQSATKAFYYYDTAGWKDSKGNQVKNWKQKMHGVWFKDENLDKGKPCRNKFIT